MEYSIYLDVCISAFIVIILVAILFLLFLLSFLSLIPKDPDSPGELRPTVGLLPPSSSNDEELTLVSHSAVT